MILKHSKLFDDLNIWSRLSVRFILEDYLYEGGYPKFPGPLEVATSGQYAHSIWWTKHIYLKICIYIYRSPPETNSHRIASDEFLKLFFGARSLVRTVQTLGSDFATSRPSIFFHLTVRPSKNMLLLGEDYSDFFLEWYGVYNILNSKSDSINVVCFWNPFGGMFRPYLRFGPWPSWDSPAVTIATTNVARSTALFVDLASLETSSYVWWWDPEKNCLEMHVVV